MCTLGKLLLHLVFSRIYPFSIGFEWSADESCALLQHFGGPCAVLAPIQALFIRELIFNDSFDDSELPNVIRQNLQNISGELMIVLVCAV